MTSPTDQPPSTDGETHTDHSELASAIERGIFASRWLLAPLYLGLTVSLLLIFVKFVQGTVELARQTGDWLKIGGAWANRVNFGSIS